MAYPYFPIALQQLGATMRYHTLVERAFQIGDLRVPPVFEPPCADPGLSARHGRCDGRLRD